MIAVLTDSTCDLGPVQLGQLGVSVLPLSVQIGGHSYRDWEDIDPDILFDQMQEGAQPSTSPPGVEAFSAAYRRLLAVYDHVLSVHLSGELSETVAQARAAAAELGRERVTVIDTGFATAPQGELVMLAARLAREGHGAQAIAARLEALRAQLFAEFSVESLEYLRRDGRLSRSGELLGHLLRLRPVLRFEAGRIVADRRVRAGGATADMIARLEERYGTAPIHVAVAHAGRDRERTDEVRKALEGSRLQIRSGRIQLIGAVIGAHVGPGTVGLVAYPAEDGGAKPA